MSQHYCPDCQSVCTCPALDVLDCAHACALEGTESLEYTPPPPWPWQKTFPSAAPAWDREDGWPC